ncbi:MAG: tRNA (adenosine(37)-N6)-threonylcarbamoyltransferase complex dimerization subunit type 1 TsaB [Bacteroidales bacterium]|nr:tRNA (adenosine(37)-N6)-threonylcarbamoyltransferase complex dimerization subunit type 1 TsaB [Bacteroidales bacterium]
MTKILLIETATQVCSVALAEKNKVIFSKETNEPNAHSEKLMPFIQETLTETGIAATSLDAVAVSKGPGSYTGLRIGVSAAKGLCYSLGIPLLAVNTLESMAFGMREKHRQEELYFLLCPMIDARRMEVYSAVYCKRMKEIRETRAEVIDQDSFRSLLDSYKMFFFGSGAPKCKEIIHHRNAFFEEGFLPSATHMASLASGRFETGKIEDTAYFEPFYLKDFIAGVPRVRGL